MVGETSRVLIGVCTLNEADNIRSLLERLRAALPEAEILIVDDNSDDGTIAIVESMSHQDPAIKITVRQHQRGLGTAIRAAMSYAIEHGYRYFLNLDADLSHDPRELALLLDRAIQEPNVDVVIGSRYVPGGSIVGWPVHRRVMSRIVNRFAAVGLRLPVKDCSGAMRCYRVPTLQRVGISKLRISGYAALEELLVHLHHNGATMSEVPITFNDRAKGTSKLTPREAIRSMAQVVALAWRR